MGSTVIITGNRGYLGTVLTRRLRKDGYVVVGLDAGIYDGVFDLPYDAHPHVQLWGSSLAELPAAFYNPTAVVHLAALSNDVLGEIAVEHTFATNIKLVADVASLFIDHPPTVRPTRQILASSCSVYGAPGHMVDEASPVGPLTAYAASKVMAEELLSHIAPSSVSLRFGTLWGASPNMRPDLAINAFAYQARSGSVAPISDAKRPFLHVEDAADAIAVAIKSDITGIVNVPGENMTVNEAAKMVAEVAEVDFKPYVGETEGDLRSYWVKSLSPIPLQLSNRDQRIEELLDCVDQQPNALPRVEAYKLWLNPKKEQYYEDGSTDI
jgi:nucleoside-diphosphate-sugar epimerase